MLQGTVKCFSPEKGFGFIAPARTDPAPPVTHATDVFVHFSAIEMHGYKYLSPLQPVAYEVMRREDGRLFATRVVVQEDVCRASDAALLEGLS